MAKNHTEKECLNYIGEACYPLYSKSFINWNGKTEDTGKEYQELFSAYIYERLENNALPGVSKLDFDRYCEKDRDLSKEGTGEEKVQRKFYQKEFKDFGMCIWYELRANKNGKGIDLVFFNKETNALTVCELKHNSKETLLRAALELQTYYQSIQWEKALAELRERAKEINIAMPEDLSKVPIKKCILINKGCKATSSLNEDGSLKENSALKKLLDAFEMKVEIYEI